MLSLIIVGGRLFENTENSFAVVALFFIKRMIFKRMVGVVFQYQPATRVEHLLVEDKRGNLVDGGQRIGWTGKDIIIAGHTGLDEFKHIGPHDLNLIGDMQRLGSFFYKIHTGRKFVNIRYICAASRDKLITVVAGAAEKIEHFDFFKIKLVLQNIEQPLLRIIGCRAGGPVVCRRMKTPPLEFSADDAHVLLMISYGINAKIPVCVVSTSMVMKKKKWD